VTTSRDSNQSRLTTSGELLIGNPEAGVASVPETRVPHPKSRAYAAWVTVCLVWGTTYLAIRIALESIPPLLMGGIRYVIAGSMLAAILAARGERLPGPREWPYLAVLGTLLIGFGNGGVVWAEQTVPSGLTAVLVATSPFWMTGIDAMLPHDSRIRVPGALRYTIARGLHEVDVPPFHSLRDFAAEPIAIVFVPIEEANIGAIAARRGDFHFRSVFGETNYRPRAGLARGERNGLRMIAGRDRDDAASFFIVVK